MSAIDVELARAATPGCEGRSFLNNAGAALPTRATVDAVIAHLRREADVGGYLAAAEAEDRIAAARRNAARLVNAHPHEIALTTSDTAAWVKAFWGFVLGGGLGEGDRVVVDRLAYSSHYLALLQAVRAFGVRIDVLPVGRTGGLDVDSLEMLYDERVRLVATTHVGTNCGLVNPVAEVGRAARDAGVPFFLDACQSAGQLPVDVVVIGCDVATTTGRKFLRAPRGTGLLFVRDDFHNRLDPPGIDGTSASWVDAARYDLGPTAARFEEFEASIAGRVGLANALEELLAIGIDPIHERDAMLADRMRRGLEALEGVTVEDGSGERSAIVTFRVDGVAPSTIVAAAADHGVVVTTTTAPWARLDMAARGLDELVRASPHYYNTERDVDRLLEVIATLRG